MPFSVTQTESVFPTFLKTLEVAKILFLQRSIVLTQAEFSSGVGMRVKNRIEEKKLDTSPI